MRPRAALASLRTLATPPITRRATLVASLGVLERTLAPALAWTLVQRTLRDKVAVTLLFGGVFTVRAVTQRMLLARNQAELLERTAASVLAGDVLQADILADQDLHLEAAQAVYQTSLVFSQTLPNAVGDALACVLLAAGVAWLEPARLVVLAAALTLVAAGALLVSRRAVAGALERWWKVQDRAYEAFGEALEGRLEIVASGRREAFLADLGERTRAWGAAGCASRGPRCCRGAWRWRPWRGSWPRRSSRTGSSAGRWRSR